MWIWWMISLIILIACIIFAYRMICKDSIEDKILKLQEKKKTLAKELITDDSSFTKALTKEDVEYLFS